MSRALPAVVTLLVVLAGCGVPASGPPAATDHDVAVSVSNDHDEPALVRVTALPPAVDGVEVTYENGSTRRFDVPSFDALPRGSLRNATAVAPTGAERPSTAFVVDPSAGVGTTLEDVPANATVAYFLLTADGRRVRAAGVVRCTPNAEATDLTVRIRPDGSVHSSVSCRDEAS
jgi:hypothetical protein